MATTMTVLVVHLAGGRYAVRADDVREVVRAVAVTPLPGLPPVVEGVIDYRGEIVPVVSLRSRFRLPARPPELGDRMVIADGAGRRVALRVDEVETVEGLEPAAVSEAEGLWAAGQRVAGVVRLGEGLVLIAEMGAFLSETEAAAVDEALAAAAGGGA